MKKFTRFLKINLLWFQFIAFAIIGVITKKDASIFISQGPYGAGKYMIWLLFFSFLGYTIYSSRKENFYKSIKQLSQMYWGIQIGIDLYIGTILPLLIIYLHGGGTTFLLWIIPVLINVNLFTLLYFGLNYDSIITYFNL